MGCAYKFWIYEPSTFNFYCSTTLDDPSAYFGSPIVVCYVMTRGDFTRVLGNLQDIMDGKVKPQRKNRVSTLTQVVKKYELDELKVMNVLGQGAFGKVKLVKAKDTGEFYALKAQGKKFIIDNGQKNYIINEMKLMQKLKHPNILIMHCAMQDPKYIYFLLGLLPGGELMNILESKGKFSEEWAKFYSASVLLAYTEFHAHRVAYRDLKPENMVLDAKGYCVVVDLGLAKQLDDGPTYTFCGTPDYIAPELIRGTGYSWAVDYWALGVLLVSIRHVTNISIFKGIILLTHISLHQTYFSMSFTLEVHLSNPTIPREQLRRF